MVRQLLVAVLSLLIAASPAWAQRPADAQGSAPAQCHTAGGPQAGSCLGWAFC